MKNETCPKCGATKTHEEAKFCVCGHKWESLPFNFEGLPDAWKDLFGGKKK